MSRGWFLAVVAVVGLAGCNIIIDPSGADEDQGGGSMENWPDSPDGGCAALDENDELPTAQLLILVRMTHPTMVLAPDIELLRDRMREALYKQKFILTHTLVAPLVPESGVASVFYWDSCTSEAPVSLRDAVGYYAARVVGANTWECEHDMLSMLGQQLGALQPAYPSDLAPGFSPKSGSFMRKLASRLVVLYVDPRGRNQDLGACFVGTQPVPEYFMAENGDGLTWLSIDGKTMDSHDVTHLAVITSESGEAEDAMATRCLATPGFRAGAVDVLMPSEHSYFGPFAEAFDKAGVKQAATLDLCVALGEEGADSLAVALPEVK